MTQLTQTDPTDPTDSTDLTDSTDSKHTVKTDTVGHCDIVHIHTSQRDHTTVRNNLDYTQNTHNTAEHNSIHIIQSHITAYINHQQNTHYIIQHT